MNDETNNSILFETNANTPNDVRLNLLYEIGRILASQETMDAAAAQILETICRGLQFEIGKLWWLDKNEAVLKLGCVWHSPSSPLLEKFAAARRRFDFAVGDDLPGAVWARNAPVWMEDLSVGDKMPRRLFVEEFGLRSGFAFPIMLGDQLLGVCSFFSAEPHSADASLLQMFVAVGSNIGQFIKRERVESHFRDSEERYRALVEATSTVVWRTNDRGEMIFVGTAWEKVSGQTVEQILGAGWLDALHPDDRDKTIKIWQTSLAAKNVYENEFRVLTASGEYRWFAVRGVPILNSDGSVREWIGANTDVHERKIADEKVRDSEARFRQLADNAPVMIWVTDATGFCHYLSQSWYDFTGQTPETGLGSGWIDATHPDDAAMAGEEFMRANEKRARFWIEYRLRRADGSYAWAIDSA